MVSITLTLEIDPDFDDSEVIAVLDKYKFSTIEPKTVYQKWIKKGHNLTVTRFLKKILIQGKENPTNLLVIDELAAISKLNFDKQDPDNLKLFEFSHNAIHCRECPHPSVMLINGMVEDSNFVFRQECGHESRMKPPFLVYTSRILPDMSVIVAGYISKCLKLGYFENFELLIPNFIIQSADLFIGKSQKRGFKRELDALRELENENKIQITYYDDGASIPESREEYERNEDNIILEIAKITNSILFTGDGNLKLKSTLDHRPTIYIDPDYAKQIKTLSEDSQ